MALHILGVRHHSPACARLVRGAIRALRPRHVLIEGPADMNGRLGELRLAHTPPIALFTYYRHAGRGHASWSPFCRSSPEWVALAAAEEVGAEARFMDLPAWTAAFAGVRNRYGDRPVRDRRDRYSEVVTALCRRFGVDDSDALWDHLFEQPLPAAELAARLDEYFEALRGGDPHPDEEQDGPREDFMLRCLGWALADAARHGGDVVAVCGGFHAPALRRRAAPDAEAGGAFPAAPQPDEGARCGTYLVPYSFQRLDSFVGYESGMPSPAFYDAVWELGPENAAETMLRAAVERLRGRRQQVSPADLIACSTQAAALARLRGHSCLARVDLLDGIAGTLVKDGLDAPLPWSYRGTLRPRTDPLLVEVVAALSGERAGRLAAETPRPPLLADVAQILDALDLDVFHLVPGAPERRVTLDLTRERDRERSRVLHRLRVLEIPGFLRESGPAWATDAALTEVWRLAPVFEAESCLIEAAAWGPSLESAAAARLEDALLEAEGRLAALAHLLGEAVFVGIEGLSARVLAAVAEGVHREPSFAELGQAAARLLALWRHDDLFGARGAEPLGLVLAEACDRGLWLLEGIQGPAAPADEAQIAGVAALRDIVRSGGFGESRRDRAAAVMERRAAAPEAPPALRGAALGVLWSLGLCGEEPEAAERALRVLLSLARAATLGDFLAGLFALAREEVLAAEGLLAAVDAAVCGFGPEDFLVALPSLRLAFSWFPPAERERIAGLALRLHGSAGAARELLTLDVPAAEVARGLALEAAVSATAARYGLEGS